VNRCRDYGDLVGPYVLGALEPAEAEEMERHLAECHSCALERRRLAGLPALLDAAQPDDISVAALSPQLEDAVLDQFVRERARSARPRRRWPRLAIPAAAAATVILAVALALILPGGDHSAYARADLWSMSGQVLGKAEVAEVEGGTRVQLRAHHLPVSHGKVYELWCVRTDGRWINGGSFQARSDGTAAAQLTAAVQPGEYHVVVVTRRSTGGERGAEVMRGKLSY
jgi:anti-sigma-K factor RskA